MQSEVGVLNDNPEKAPALSPRWKKILFTIVKWTWIPLICMAALFAGLAIGYAVIGHGDFKDVWDLGTWRHLFDLVFAAN
ncbi:MULTISPECIES: DNA-directed RNA polymerase subunit beta [Paenibacillus]|uniref:DNA-directed RNA polymerase subunit beta n=1 Tax=Paenibacillus TaxID=44249 RepID=UPI0022B8E5EE|nr:DNA-directed RNA polymerase subunit beta [Paenibacillus caseinilyticus]MCZ8523334.1 DNA-directed RNA polymerase subunit beta [Paenibacillus caseinilyticus]